MGLTRTGTGEDAAVVWHELECGSYTADLALWSELAVRHEAPILDVGAGTGRVTLQLAREGHDMHALDADAALLAHLEHHAAGLALTTHHTDARSFTVDERFGLVLAPMQLVQLLGGADGRASFLRRVREHLRDGGLLAAAIAEDVEPFGADEGLQLAPDICERGGTLYSSAPVSITLTRNAALLARRREHVGPDGERHVEAEIVTLDKLTAAELEHEGALAGLRVLPRTQIPATAEHVGSTVVMLGA